MNIFHKVTIESLKKNRTRTIVTIIGIMLSTALICAVTSSVASVIDFGRRYFSYESGSWHGSEIDQPFEEYEKIRTADGVDKAVYCKYEGYAKVDSENEYKPYLYLMGAGEGYEEIMPVHIIEGHYPQNDSEILIPGHLYENGGVNWKTGDKITLEVGERMRDGHAVGQESPIFDRNAEYNSDEVIEEDFKVRLTKEYTVCGIYQRPNWNIEDYYAAGYTAIVHATDSEIIPETYRIFFSMKKPNEVYDFMEKNGCSGATNSELLMFYGVTRYSTVRNMLFGLAAIIIVLIMFGSVMLIYNAFSISVSERTKQFGLLSSVGATKKQLRKMVKFESFVVSVIGIPLGILLGIAGIGVTFLCMGNIFDSLIGVDTDAGCDVQMKLKVSAIAIAAAVLIALVTVRISAWVPSRRATKVSAVEAVRMSADIKNGKRKLKTPKLVYKLFGLSGMIGHKYYKRSKKRYRTTVVSLFMSIVLFVSASAFTDYLVKSIELSTNAAGYDIEYYIYDDTDKNFDEHELLEELRSAEGVTNVSLIKQGASTCMISKDVIDKNILDIIGSELDENGMFDSFIVISFTDDATFTKLCEENGLNKADFIAEGSPKGIAYDGNSYFVRETGRVVRQNMLSSDNCTFKCYSYKQMDDAWFEEENSDGTATYRNENDETFELPLDECKLEFDIETIKTVHEKPFFNNSSGLISVVYPESVMDEVYLKYKDYISAMYAINSDTPEVTYKDIEDMLKNENLSKLGLHNLAEEEQRERNLVTIVKVFSYGFIVMISLIAAANVFNTISTNISLRRREFAMLRSIGMTSRGIRKILNYECVIYGIKSLLAGLPVSALMTYFIFKAVDISIDVDYYLPWDAVAIASFSVFAVVFATMMYSMSKLKKDDPVETLKNENI